MHAHADGSTQYSELPGARAILTLLYGAIRAAVGTPEDRSGAVCVTHRGYCPQHTGSGCGTS